MGAVHILKEFQLGKKGALISTEIDAYKSIFPDIKEYFYLVECRHCQGMNDSVFADIKLVEDESTFENTKKRFSNTICLNLGGGDFTDGEIFKPIDSKEIFTAIHIAAWIPCKRYDLFLQAVRLLPDEKFINIGYFHDNKQESRILKENIVKKAPINIEMAHECWDASKINNLINQSSMGILCSDVEGMNRFKMECMAADKPFLVASDSNQAIKKHINSQTGMIFEPTPEKLAEAILYVKNNRNLYSPRKYFLEHTGKVNSSKLLLEALNFLCKKDKIMEHFRIEDINFNGRNYLWGESALKAVRGAVEKARSLKK